MARSEIEKHGRKQDTTSSVAWSCDMLISSIMMVEYLAKTSLAIRPEEKAYSPSADNLYWVVCQGATLVDQIVNADEF